jgi:hypothetical protein
MLESDYTHAESPKPPPEVPVQIGTRPVPAGFGIVSGWGNGVAHVAETSLTKSDGFPRELAVNSI